MKSSRRTVSVCIIPSGNGPVRTLHLRPRTLPALALSLLALIAALGYYSFLSYNQTNNQVNHLAELEVLRLTNASQEAQLELFAERVAALDAQMAQIRGRDLEVAALKSTVSHQLGFEAEAPLDELLPYLTATLSWVDNKNNHNGVGGSELFASTLSAAAAVGASRDQIRGLHRDLDRLMLEMDDAGRYLGTVKEGLSGASSVLAATPLFLPVGGRISARFGNRPSPFDGVSLDHHRGVDIPAPMGTVVRAPADGTVLSLGQSGGYGLMLTVDHGYGLVTRYAHLSGSLMEPGDKVRRGQGIARTGNSGRSTGPHLHYETLLGGVAVDPLRLLPPDVVKNLVFKPSLTAAN